MEKFKVVLISEDSADNAQTSLLFTENKDVTLVMVTPNEAQHHIQDAHLVCMNMGKESINSAAWISARGAVKANKSPVIVYGIYERGEDPEANDSDVPNLNAWKAANKIITILTKEDEESGIFKERFDTYHRRFQVCRAFASKEADYFDFSYLPLQEKKKVA